MNINNTGDLPVVREDGTPISEDDMSYIKNVTHQFLSEIGCSQLIEGIDDSENFAKILEIQNKKFKNYLIERGLCGGILIPPSFLEKIIKCEIFEVEFYGERCCEECNEIVHNHFDCPVCHRPYASTSIYCAVWDMDDDDTFSCDECNTIFRLTLPMLDNLKYRIRKE